MKKKPFSKVKLFKQKEINKLTKTYNETQRGNLEYLAMQFNMLVKDFQLFHEGRITAFDNYVNNIDAEYKQCIEKLLEPYAQLGSEDIDENIIEACGWLIASKQMIQEDLNNINKQIAEEIEHLDRIRAGVEVFDIEDIENELLGNDPFALIFRRTIIDDMYFANRLSYFNSDEFFEKITKNVMFRPYVAEVRRDAKNKRLKNIQFNRNPNP